MRLDELLKIAKRRRLDSAIVTGEANVLALTGVKCDNAVLRLVRKADGRSEWRFFTDFRYAAMVHRVAPLLKTADIRRLSIAGNRIGFEGSISKRRFDSFSKLAGKSSTFVDIDRDLAEMRSVKSAEEIERLRAAEKLNCEIWRDASRRFKPGMSERDMARLIKVMMIERGEGEAFDTIVCVGANAAECHHEPDDTVWNGRDAVLVDMGVKFGGVCSDLTRNILPRRPSPSYRRVYELVKQAHDAAIAAARPGITAFALDKVARDIIRKGGFGKCFGHSLGHGVGYEIHEAPTVSSRNRKTVLKPGMVVTVEPGIYLEDNLGVRIEDMILITHTGCELLSSGVCC